MTNQRCQSVFHDISVSPQTLNLKQLFAALICFFKSEPILEETNRETDLILNDQEEKVNQSIAHEFCFKGVGFLAHIIPLHVAC